MIRKKCVATFSRARRTSAGVILAVLAAVLLTVPGARAGEDWEIAGKGSYIPIPASARATYEQIGASGRVGGYWAGPGHYVIAIAGTSAGKNTGYKALTFLEDGKLLFGRSTARVAEIKAHVARLRAQHPGVQVSVVGHSLGAAEGLMAFNNGSADRAVLVAVPGVTAQDRMGDRPSQGLTVIRALKDPVASDRIMPLFRGGRLAHQAEARLIREGGASVLVNTLGGGVLDLNAHSLGGYIEEGVGLHQISGGLLPGRGDRILPEPTPPSRLRVFAMSSDWEGGMNALGGAAGAAEFALESTDVTLMGLERASEGDPRGVFDMTVGAGGAALATGTAIGGTGIALNAFGIPGGAALLTTGTGVIEVAPPVALAAATYGTAVVVSNKAGKYVANNAGAWQNWGRGWLVRLGLAQDDRAFREGLGSAEDH